MTAPSLDLTPATQARAAVPVPVPVAGSPAAGSGSVADPAATGALRLDGIGAWYGAFRAVKDVVMDVPARQVTAMIGPSGCGKSTVIRTLNRMHEVIPGARVEGHVTLDGSDLYGPTVDPVRVRRLIGMVFQRPNPFPTMSIRDNVAAGVRLGGKPTGRQIDEVVEHSLRRAALWDEVKDKLKQRATALSGGQQQRLCIARALAVEPRVLLMDEPCSALDPIATGRIEDLIAELRDSVTIVIVTHNLQQAARVSDQTAFFLVDADRAGYLVEIAPTAQMFTSPTHQLTEDYVSGRFG
jgi:phosphate transport system ATP-binding protein